MRTILVVLASLLFSIGCKDKPSKKAPPPNVGSAQGSGSGGSRPAPDLVLPRADGTPPKKTAKPHTKADYERLSKLEFPGFTPDVRTLGEKVFEVRHKTKDHPRLWAVVTIKHCFDCLPMDLAKWKEKETELNGQKIIYAYQVGLAQAPGEGGGSTSFTNNYHAYFNDGINEIRVVGTYKDDPVSSEDLKKLAPKEDLRALALSFLDYFTHQW